MSLKRVISWKILLPSCAKSRKVKNSSSEPSKSNIISKQGSLLRLSLSDVSNPGSPISLSDLSNSLVGSNLHIFTLKELKGMTQNFSKSEFLGEGGFGPVYKGYICDKLRPGLLEAQPVAVKKLDLNGSQGHREWLAEVIFLGQLKHPHLVNLIGYCYENEHRLLVYEYMAKGNLDNQLFKNYSETLPWLTRIKIAIGAAQCLAFLHEEEKPVIYRDLKAANILLDSDYNAKLSDFGLATDGPLGDNSHITTCVMGTEGYAAPEYINTGHLTTMCDVYSFGVVLLELLTGKRSVDKNRSKREQDLVEWARPMLKDCHRLNQIMDPRLEGQYSTEGAKKAAALAHQCLSHSPKSRSTMRVVVNTLEPLLDLTDIPIGPFVYTVNPEGKICDEARIRKIREEIGEKKFYEKGRIRHQKGRKHNHRRRIKASSKSRAVHSDTTLYKALGTSLYTPRN
ncbi:hypothetical protein Dsin_014263 [Dipteronia sinensis]|uniref:non-specific serine/threonine protein kinase n=1 Tax=Dipteronia sinensis TaxID=43782 RepID=A0AAE0ALZ5_9ROSI|nr:hypothetical protein Dsin_014263 [Dipteronia sinensis]